MLKRIFNFYFSFYQFNTRKVLILSINNFYMRAKSIEFFKMEVIDFVYLFYFNIFDNVVSLVTN